MALQCSSEGLRLVLHLGGETGAILSPHSLFLAVGIWKLGTHEGQRQWEKTGIMKGWESKTHNFSKAQHIALNFVTSCSPYPLPFLLLFTQNPKPSTELSNLHVNIPTYPFASRANVCLYCLTMVRSFSAGIGWALYSQSTMQWYKLAPGS